MRFKICLSIAFFYHAFFTPTLTGQQIYTSDHYGEPGTVHLYSRHLGGFTNDEITASGADITWDVSDLEFVQPNPSQIVTRDQAIDAFTFSTLCALGGINIFECLTIFNNTQQAWLQQDTQSLIQFQISDLQRFQRKTNDYLLETFFGFTVDLNGSTINAVIVYQEPDTILNFPVVFHDTITSHITWGIDLTPAGQNIQYVSHQHRFTTVDAWGTLMTPFGTYGEALRVRSVIARNDTLTSDTLSVPISITQVEYAWYDQAYGLPVMIANGLILDTVETINVLQYLNDQSCLGPELILEADMLTYFLDENGEAHAVFTVDELVPADIYTWVFGDGTIVNGGPEMTHTYTDDGAYTVTVVGCLEHCLPLNSCTEVTLEIEVIDTTSAIHLPDAAGDGIRLYPNPASDHIVLDIPQAKGGMQYALLDQHGRMVISAHAGSGVHVIRTDGLAAGLYLVRLTDADSGKIYRASRIMLTE